MNSELLEANFNSTEQANEDNQEIAFRALVDAELLLVGGGGGDVIWG